MSESFDEQWQFAKKQLTQLFDILGIDGNPLEHFGEEPQKTLKKHKFPKYKRMKEERELLAWACALDKKMFTLCCLLIKAEREREERKK